jgi:hypothetical protein
VDKFSVTTQRLEGGFAAPFILFILMAGALLCFASQVHWAKAVLIKRAG